MSCKVQKAMGFEIETEKFVKRSGICRSDVVNRWRWMRDERMKGWRGRRREKEEEEEGWNVFIGETSSGDQPTDVCDQPSSQTATASSSNPPRMLLLFSCRIIQSSPPCSAQGQGLAAAPLGVMVRTPLGRIATHARDRSRTRQAR